MKPLELGKPGGPDGPPVEARKTLAFKIGYYGAFTILVGLTILTPVGIGFIIARLAF